MLKNNRDEISESGKMLALTMVLTNFLLLAVSGGVFWLVRLVLSENHRLAEITRGFTLQ
jgi:hypothetical protein